MAERKPLRVTTDKHPAYRRSIRWILGRKVLHRDEAVSQQLHRAEHIVAVKQRYYPMLGFGNFESASRFCTAFDELRQYFRVRRRGDDHVSLAEQRRLFLHTLAFADLGDRCGVSRQRRETVSSVPSLV